MDATSRKYREATYNGADGVVDLPNCFGMRVCVMFDHPVCAEQGCFATFS